MLQSALSHYAQQRRIVAEGAAVARARRFGPLDALVGAVVSYQVRAAREAAAAVPLMLDEQGLTAPPEAEAQVSALAGRASDGSSLSGLLEYAQGIMVTKVAFDRIVATQLQDVARQAVAVEMAIRPRVTGYVRTLVPPSCARCAVLAGKRFRKNTGFLRHPRCNCCHVPTTMAAAPGVTADPQAYFGSLPLAEQNRVFTHAAAEAIRRGADMGRVVNARRGMETSQAGREARRMVAGQNAYTTTELAGARVRLMPESILEIGTDDADILRLLKRHGYIY